MGRPLRIAYSGALHQVMSRGNERRPVVRDDADRVRRLDWLRRAVGTYGWRLHAFALLDNHEHLFVETPEPLRGLSLIKQGVGLLECEQRDESDPAYGIASVSACQGGASDRTTDKGRPMTNTIHYSSSDANPLNW